MTKKESRIILFSITLCWASSYIFIKDVPHEFSPYLYLALTSGTAGIILALVFSRLFREMTWKTLLHGTMLALLITGNMLLEKFGLERISASAASTIASSSIILVPLILLLKKQYPSRNNWAGIAIILTGILVSNHVRMHGNGLAGTLYMLGACTLMSFYTILATEYAKQSNPLLLTVLQLVITGGVGLVLWAVFERTPLSMVQWNAQTISYIMLIAFFAKAYAYLMLMYADKYADALSVTVVASTEPVVTLLLALLIPDAGGATEAVSVRSIIGALIITCGAIVAGTDFLDRKDSKAAEQGTESDAKHVPQNLHVFSSEWKRFFVPFLFITVIFAGIGVAVSSIMKFAGGYSDLRPRIFLSVFSGLLFGPAGALACTAGNLIADLFIGNYGRTVILGIIGNFLMAFVPYKLWNAIYGRQLHVHTWKRLMTYIVCAGIGCMACSVVLGNGLEELQGVMGSIIPNIFLNNFGFSLVIGLPVFIVLTNEKVSLPFYRPVKTSGPSAFSAAAGRCMLAVDAIALMIVLLMSIRGYHVTKSAVFRGASAVSAVCILLTLALPCRGEEMQTANVQDTPGMDTRR